MLSEKIKEEERRMFSSMMIPFFLVVLMWAVKIVEAVGGYDFSFLGIYPLRWQNLYGILTTPFVHGDFKHLLANTVPIFVLGSALFYFYKDIAWRILILTWLFTGIWVWIAARPAYHIGASGIVYGLAAFIFTSGILRRHAGLMSVALIVVFLYGSLIWGVFPEFFPQERISWESHLFGLVAGVAMAFVYRKEGPQRRKYSWELEEEEEGIEEGDASEAGKDDEEEAYWKSNIS
jgi:membrane associated rhomboid family serine protease